MKGVLLYRGAGRAQIAEESLGNIRTVRSFAKERHEINQYKRSVYHAYTLGRSLSVAQGGFMGGVFILGQGAVAFVLWLGGHLVVDNTIGPNH